MYEEIQLRTWEIRYIVSKPPKEFINERDTQGTAGHWTER